MLVKEDKGVRTYKATDDYGNEAETQVEIKYTVTLDGVKQGVFSWGQTCTLSAGEPKAWIIDGVKVADGVNTYNFAVIRDMDITTAEASSAEQVAAVAASMSSPASGYAVFDAMWTIPTNVTIKSVAIYSGTTSTDKTITAQTLINYGLKTDVDLTLRNGSYSLKINDLNPEKYLHAVIVITFVQDRDPLISDVQKIQPNGQANLLDG